MGKSKKIVEPRQDVSVKRSEPKWWNTMMRNAALALVVATGLTLLATYKEVLTDVIKPTVNSGWAWLQDHFSPMSEDKIIAVELKFYIPSDVNKRRSFEAMSATFWPKRCKRPEGASIVRTFDSGGRDSYTNAIVRISCRASGRTLVTLTPQSGPILTVYDGIFKDGEVVSFPGVPGSYYAGLLSMYLLDTDMPAGPRVPINKCQINDTCAEKLN